MPIDITTLDKMMQGRAIKRNDFASNVQFSLSSC